MCALTASCSPRSATLASFSRVLSNAFACCRHRASSEEILLAEACKSFFSPGLAPTAAVRSANDALEAAASRNAACSSSLAASICSSSPASNLAPSSAPAAALSAPPARPAARSAMAVTLLTRLPASFAAAAAAAVFAAWSRRWASSFIFLARSANSSPTFFFNVACAACTLAARARNLMRPSSASRTAWALPTLEIALNSAPFSCMKAVAFFTAAATSSRALFVLCAHAE
mmetsp:Transcript_50573/g.145806  ORF Transcript_50573/g.145806 Transcript_50573/m.145806 type:complete len:231 (+) Transcript_50573:1454-2146(+)